MNQSSCPRAPVQTWVFTLAQAPTFNETVLNKLRIKLGFKAVVRKVVINGSLTYRISAQKPAFATKVEEYMLKILPDVPSRNCDPCSGDFH